MRPFAAPFQPPHHFTRSHLRCGRVSQPEDQMDGMDNGRHRRPRFIPHPSVFSLSPSAFSLSNTPGNFTGESARPPPPMHVCQLRNPKEPLPHPHFCLLPTAFCLFPHPVHIVHPATRGPVRQPAPTRTTALQRHYKQANPLDSPPILGYKTLEVSKSVPTTPQTSPNPCV